MPKRKKAQGKRSTMRDSNARARAYLFGLGWDWLWFKSHEDMRKKSAGDYYYLALDQSAHRCLDPYNLFDAIGYDAEGYMWWIQIKTDNWPDEDAIKAFMLGKKNVGVLAIKIMSPTKTIRNYRIVTKEWVN